MASERTCSNAEGKDVASERTCSDTEGKDVASERTCSDAEGKDVASGRTCSDAEGWAATPPLSVNIMLLLLPSGARRAPESSFPRRPPIGKRCSAAVGEDNGHGAPFVRIGICRMEG